MNKLRKLIGLSWRERLMLLHAGVTVAVVRAALYVLPFAIIRRHLSRDLPLRVDAAAAIQADQLARFVVIASRFVPRATCLTQALSLQHLLARRAIDSKLCIGVGRNEKGAFHAHAWIDRQGSILVGGDIDLNQLVPLPSISPPPINNERTLSQINGLA